MIALHGKTTRAELDAHLSRSVWLLADPSREPEAERADTAAALLAPQVKAASGFRLHVGRPGASHTSDVPYVELPAALDYLARGDVISVSSDGRRVRVLWRQASAHNALFLTERCDQRCLMCSQPPRDVPDEWLLEEALEVVALLPADTAQIAITGGEPTLHGDRLLELLASCRDHCPVAAIHVLTNGRRFSDADYADAWADLENANLMVGIPIYGAEPTLHDYVVQARGAFEEAVSGILNLARREQRIEVRVVIHKQTAAHLTEIAEFIARNLPFVEHVALMGLEMTGLARANAAKVWIDPVDYRDALTEAVALLAYRRVPTSIYNHQLCLLDPRVWPHAVKSISDWKSGYTNECARCGLRERCGGLFETGSRRSERIHALADPSSFA